MAAAACRAQGGRKRTAVADPPLAVVSLGVLRPVHWPDGAPDRRVLLAQGLLADLGARRGRADRQQPRLQREPRLLLDRIHVRRRHARRWSWAATFANCYNEFATFVHGTKCAAQFSGNIHAPTVHTYKDQRVAADNIDWNYGYKEDKAWSTRFRGAESPWQEEWNVLLAAIRNDTPHNETQRAAYSDLASIMGRAAVHMGRVITWEEASTRTSSSARNSTN